MAPLRRALVCWLKIPQGGAVRGLGVAESREGQPEAVVVAGAVVGVVGGGGKKIKG